jgi:hypothetical protein
VNTPSNERRPDRVPRKFTPSLKLSGPYKTRPYLGGGVRRVPI